MRKKIWILNHYATITYFDHGGRHFSFARYLVENGYDVTIFCANTIHGKRDTVEVREKYKVEHVYGINYVFVKCMDYDSNGINRIINMVSFYKNIKRIANKFEKPEVIIGSSVHPLACIAANKLAKRYNCKSICEIRDLWPESIVAYGILSKRNILIKLLYLGEKWMYKNADAVIMTWAGGYDYIKKQRWDKQIPKEKVYHISNGVDLKDFDENVKNNKYEDDDLNNKDKIKFVYTGSIRFVNNLRVLVEAAEIISQRGIENIEILVWGDGDQRQSLEQMVKEKNLSNIKFKGKVEKRYIPSILSQSDVSILHNTSTSLNEYGQSQNKFFEYLAAGHPVLMTYSVGHSTIKEKNCGIELEMQDPFSIADAMEYFANASHEEISNYCERVLESVKEFDYPELTKELIRIIEM